jgi:2-iminobutanoate/2-iminopropanoate deaminase
MTKQHIRTVAAPTPTGAYSQGVECDGFLFTAGFGPQAPDSGAIAETIEGQTAQVLRNIRGVLSERGLTLADVVKATVHLQHLHRDFNAFDQVYRSFFELPYPVRTTVGSELNGILVEIDVVARTRG